MERPVVLGVEASSLRISIGKHKRLEHFFGLPSKISFILLTTILIGLSSRAL